MHRKCSWQALKSDFESEAYSGACSDCSMQSAQDNFSFFLSQQSARDVRLDFSWALV